ncbi:MAG: hypothetical protein PVSMB4_00730 [Ktedonobacterales bacterium]
MRELNRRAAAVKSRRATPEELREAQERYKAIQDELRQLELAPETKHGEERIERYERELRIRALREEFQSVAESRLPEPRNGVVLALVMTVASFLLCTFGAGATYFGLQLINQKPTAAGTADSFWSAIKSQDYPSVHQDFLSPTLRVSLAADAFIKQAQLADVQFGTVTSASLIKQGAGSTNFASLTYAVVRTNARGKATPYNVVLILETHQGNWGISDMGAAINPVQAGVPSPVVPTPVPATPTALAPNALLAERRGIVPAGA